MLALVPRPGGQPRLHRHQSLKKAAWLFANSIVVAAENCKSSTGNPATADLQANGAAGGLRDHMTCDAGCSVWP